MSIVIPSKKRAGSTKEVSTISKKSPNKVDLENYVEIKTKYLKHLHGSWVKYFDLSSEEYNTGGFIYRVNSDYIFLRIPSMQEHQSVALHNKTFYIKRDNENYNSLQDLMILIEGAEFKLKKITEREDYLKKRMNEFEKNKQIFYTQTKKCWNT